MLLYIALKGEMVMGNMDVNDYINLLTSITKIDRQSVYVIVVKNLSKSAIGEITPSEAYINISNELTNISNNKKKQLVVENAY
jgi:hypothetical protein